MGPGLRVQPKASQKKEGAGEVSWKWWTHPETLLLIEIWGDTLGAQCEDYKGKRILPSSAYDHIAERLSESGIKRSVGQIREKIKTLKKSYWGSVAKEGGAHLSGKRASVVEMMRRVLQANGNIVKGKYMRKADPLNATPSSQQPPSRQPKGGPKGRKRARGTLLLNEVQSEEEINGVDGSVDEEEEDEGEEEVVCGEGGMELGVDGGHVHGSMEWGAHMNGVGPEVSEEESYTYHHPPLCQLVEGLVNKFLCGQRESEERFLALEEKRMERERERWGALASRDEDLVASTLRTYERWRKEDQEQEVRMWTALLNPHPTPLSSPSPLTYRLTATLHPQDTPSTSTNNT